MKKLTKFKTCGDVNAPITGKLLYLILNEISNEDGEVAVSHSRIGSTLNISKSAVGQNLRRLRDNGYIDIYAQFHNDGGRAANKYVLR